MMNALRLVLTLLMALLVVSGGAVAVSSPREQPTDTTPPVRVFVGETIDISAVELTGGGTVGTSSTTLIGVAGDADGEVQTLSDPTAADFSDYATGTYRVSSDSDDDPEIVVTEPRVTEVTIENRNGANVTNAWDPSGENLTVTARYNFASADRLDVTVEAPDGLDITASVASSDRITTDDGSIQLDLSDQEDGTFQVILEGSNLEDATRTVTVRTGPRETATTTSSTPTATPSPTPTATPIETPEPTSTPTETPSETPSPTSTPTPTVTSEPTSTVTDTPAPKPTTSTTTPGFGGMITLFAFLSLAVYLLRRG